jgi:hypothetical protein
MACHSMRPPGNNQAEAATLLLIFHPVLEWFHPLPDSLGLYRASKKARTGLRNSTHVPF